ncbi:MAG: hypothetical protein M3R55_07895 [Acidobacteriota bacterium]|nr:hypothetical protein [Acidobacteriota bacterium]
MPRDRQWGVAAAVTAAALAMAAGLSVRVASHDRVSTRLSWDGDVARLVEARCAPCHAAAPASGAALRAPMPFDSYAATRPWARAMREAMLAGHGHTSTGGALTNFERELLVKWIDGGAPERAPIPALPGGAGTRYIRVATPAPTETLERYRKQHGGTPAIVAGLGLALRAADLLIVIERGGGTERVIANGEIVPSLTAFLAALPASMPRQRVSDAAYIIGDPAAVPRREAAEVPPDGPDRFWCPMHPDVRSAAPGICPRCGMTLIEIPPLSLDAFALDIVSSAVTMSGQTRLRLRVTRGSARVPVTRFQTLHERPFHLFVVNEALSFFAHVHPEARGDDLEVMLALPGGGRYRLIGDFMPLDAPPQLRMATLTIEREGRRQAPPQASGLSATLGPATPQAGREGRLSFDIVDTRTGKPPMDLEPFLGAAAHLFAIDEALREPMHGHPLEAPGGLTQPAFDIRFPREGRYRLWLQVQRAGRVETMPVTVDVSK